MSHDLRAPLRIAKAFSQTVLDDNAATLGEDAVHRLRRVVVAGARMEEIIEDLLRLSRISCAELHLRPVDLSELAAAVAADLQRAEPARVVCFTIAPGLIVRADRRLMRIVLENLLGNAWKYTAKHRVAHIEVGASSAGGQPTYYVRDDGDGFDMAQAGRLFVPFRRLHEPEEFSGTGIGLATVQRIVRRHGGRVWVRAAIGQGATFFFTVGDAVAEVVPASS